MVWLLLGLVALAFGLVCFLLYRSAVPRGEYSPRRRLLSLLLAATAALAAGVAAALTASDRSIEFAPLGVAVLSADAIAALATALLAASGRGRETRFAALLVAALWLAAGLATAPFVLPVAACACNNLGPSYAAPSLLGLDARTWIVQANVLGPMLLVITGLLAQASGRSTAEAN